jgi:hypothetical protein
MHPPKLRKRLTGMSKRCGKAVEREMAQIVPRESITQHNFRADMNSTIM